MRKSSSFVEANPIPGPRRTPKAV